MKFMIFSYLLLGAALRTARSSCFTSSHLNSLELIGWEIENKQRNEWDRPRHAKDLLV